MRLAFWASSGTGQPPTLGAYGLGAKYWLEKEAGTLRLAGSINFRSTRVWASCDQRSAFIAPMRLMSLFS